MGKMIKRVDLQGTNVGKILEKTENEINLGLFHEYFECSTLQDVIEILIGKMNFMASEFRNHNLLGKDEDYFQFSFNNSEYVERFGYIECIFDICNRSLTIIDHSKTEFSTIEYLIKKKIFD